MNRWTAAAIASSLLALTLALHAASQLGPPPGGKPPGRTPPAAEAAAATPAAPEQRTASSARTGDESAVDHAGDVVRELEQALDRDVAAILEKLARRPDGFARLVRLLSSKRPAVRTAASALLRTMDLPEVRRLMLHELDGTDPDRVGMAVEYFADCLEPGAIPSLSRLAGDPRENVAAPATAALVAQGPIAYETLAALLHDSPAAASRVLAAAGNAPALRPLLRAAAVRRLREGSIRSGPALDYLASDLSPEALDALVGAARISHQPGPLLGAIGSRGDAAALAVLERLADDANADLAREASRAIAELGDPRARRSLLRAIRSDDRSIRREAIGSLLRMGAPEGLRELDALVTSADARDQEYAARWLAEYGPPHADVRR
jgi:HEAT repeat protein